MARKRNDDHIRTITKVAGGKSYCITLPIKIVREMKWESQQRVLVKRRGNKIIIQENIEDGEPLNKDDSQAKFMIAQNSKANVTLDFHQDGDGALEQHKTKQAGRKLKVKK